MPQRQHYPKQCSRLLSTPHAIPQAALDTQSASYVMCAAADSANYNPPRQPINSMQSALCQAYQSNLPYRGYQKVDEKGVYQVDEDVVENQPNDFYNTFEEEGDDVIYSDEGFDKMTINFVGIETSCTKYYATFPSRSKLHNHLKSSYLEMSLFAFPPQNASSIPIIASKTVHQSFGSGLAFRGWTYATAPITLTPEHLPSDSDPNSIACLNTGCGVTLIDKA